MTQQGNWNRAARKSDGARPVTIIVSRLSRDDLLVMQQEAAIRAEFGEEGVRRFWGAMAKKEDTR